MSDQEKKNLPQHVPHHENNYTVANRQEEDEQKLNDEEKIKLTASQEKALKQEQYNHHNPKRDLNPKQNVMHTAGRHHVGNNDIQGRAQNH